MDSLSNSFFAGTRSDVSDRIVDRIHRASIALLASVCLSAAGPLLEKRENSEKQSGAHTRCRRRRRWSVVGSVSASKIAGSLLLHVPSEWEGVNLGLRRSVGSEGRCDVGLCCLGESNVAVSLLLNVQAAWWRRGLLFLMGSKRRKWWGGLGGAVLCNRWWLWEGNRECCW